jgi:small subunit ribosomal protein S11
MEKDSNIKRKKKKKSITDPAGVAHIKATFNNTHITMTDKVGNVLLWEKAGTSGFKGSRKSTAYAATMAAEKVGKEAINLGLTSVDVRKDQVQEENQL